MYATLYHILTAYASHCYHVCTLDMCSPGSYMSYMRPSILYSDDTNRRLMVSPVYTITLTDNGFYVLSIPETNHSFALTTENCESTMRQAVNYMLVTNGLGNRKEFIDGFYS